MKAKEVNASKTNSFLIPVSRASELSPLAHDRKRKNYDADQKLCNIYLHYGFGHNENCRPGLKLLETDHLSGTNSNLAIDGEFVR